MGLKGTENMSAAGVRGLYRDRDPSIPTLAKQNTLAVGGNVVPACLISVKRRMYLSSLRCR